MKSRAAGHQIKHHESDESYEHLRHDSRSEAGSQIITPKRAVGINSLKAAIDYQTGSN